jgi:hypothetical protein
VDFGELNGSIIALKWLKNAVIYIKRQQGVMQTSSEIDNKQYFKILMSSETQSNLFKGKM